MQAVKVLNNSLVLAIDEDGRECVLMGKGIGYKKAIGYMFDQEEIEKTFILQDKSILKRMIQLAKDVSDVYFQLSEDIVRYAKEKYHMELFDSIYLTLTDHIAYLIERVKNNQPIHNLYAIQLKKFNPHEVDVGEYALGVLEKELGIKIPVGEAGNIALHFMNAQKDAEGAFQQIKIADTVESILSIVKYTYTLTPTQTISWERFVLHLQLFAQRLLTNTLLPEDKDNSLLQLIQQTLQSEMDCVAKINTYTKQAFNVSFSNQEKAYLAIHIHRILTDERNKTE